MNVTKLPDQVVDERAVRRLWEEEYASVKAIPSTTRQLPSKALLLYAEMLGLGTGSKVLDIGCGNGRNAVYLAGRGCEVDAVDFCSQAVNSTRRLAETFGVADRVKSHLKSFHPRFPFDESCFDLVLDSYVFCHLLEDAQRTAYRSESRRVTKAGGIVYSSVFSVDDEYYASLGPTDSGGFPRVTDPHNGITKRLYTEDEIREFFADSFEVRYLVKFQFADQVVGQEYRRSVLALLMVK